MPINTSAVRQKTLLEFLDYDYYGVVKLQPNVAMPSGIGMKILLKKKMINPSLIIKNVDRKWKTPLLSLLAPAAEP